MTTHMAATARDRDGAYACPPLQSPRRSVFRLGFGRFSLAPAGQADILFVRHHWSPNLQKFQPAGQKLICSWGRGFVAKAPPCPSQSEPSLASMDIS